MKENSIKSNINYSLPEAKQKPLKEKEHIIKCNSCSSKILKIIEILDIKLDSRIKAQCSCGGSSFWYKMGGKLFFEPINSCIENIDQQENGMVIVCKKK